MGRIERPAKRKHKPGDKVGEWLLIRFSQNRWECICGGCGETHHVDSNNLNAGKTSKCVKCVGKDRRNSSLAAQHGIDWRDWDRLSNRYYAILSRCNTPTSKQYHHYGGRGIECRFESMPDFVLYCTTLPGWDDRDLEIDRANNSGHYERGNLRFVTRQGNCSNTRVNINIDYLGETYTAAEFHRRFAPIYRESSTVLRKIKAGYAAEQIIADQVKCKGAYPRCVERRAKAAVHGADPERPADSP
jgi:hypothetical protein